MWLTRVAEDQDEISWCLHTILKPSMSFIVESWIYFSKDKAFCPSSLEDKLPTGFSGYFILAVGKYRKFFIFLLTLNCFLFLSHLKVSPGLLELAQFIKKKNYGYMKRNTAAMGGEKKKCPATDVVAFLMLDLPLRNPCGVTLMLSPEHTAPRFISTLIN